MSCRKPATKNLTRKSKSCCNSRYDSDSYSDSSSDSYDSSSTFSDTSCGCSECDCYDCYNSPPKRRKGKGKAKGRTLQPKKSSKVSKSPCSLKKKTARRTKGTSSSCGCSKGDCSDGRSGDNECDDSYGCELPNPRRKHKRAPKRPRQRRTLQQPATTAVQN